MDLFASKHVRAPQITGRERELEALWAQFEAACEGQFSATILAGEPGIGKTRLLDELSVRARRAGTAMLRGGASEAPGMPSAEATPTGQQANCRQGLVLILDDLHWADAASLDLLCSIARRRPAARILVLGAYQEGKSGQNPSLERALSELARLRVLTTITIPPLSFNEVEALGLFEQMRLSVTLLPGRVHRAGSQWGRLAKQAMPQGIVQRRDHVYAIR